LIEERTQGLEELISYTENPELKIYSNFETFVVPCFHNLRHLTVMLIEKINSWRKLLSLNPPFTYKHIKNYMVEMTKDAT